MSNGSGSAKSRLPQRKSSGSSPNSGLLGPASSTYNSGVTRSKTLPSIRSLKKAFQLPSAGGSIKNGPGSYSYIRTSANPNPSQNTKALIEGEAEHGVKLSPSYTSRLALAVGDPPSQSRLPTGVPSLSKSLLRPGSPALTISSSSTDPTHQPMLHAIRNSNSSSLYSVSSLKVKSGDTKSNSAGSAQKIISNYEQQIQQNVVLREGNQLPPPAFYVRERKINTPPLVPLPPIPTVAPEYTEDMQSMLSLSDSEADTRDFDDTRGPNIKFAKANPVSNMVDISSVNTTTDIRDQGVDQYALTYMKHLKPSAIDAIRAQRSDSNDATVSKLVSRTDTLPVIMHSPAHSPTIVEASDRFSFRNGGLYEHDQYFTTSKDNTTMFKNSPKEEDGPLNMLRRSPSSPLSELVARLSKEAISSNDQTEDGGSPLPNASRETGLQNLQEDQEKQQNSETAGMSLWPLSDGEEASTKDEDASVDESSGISAASPGRGKALPRIPMNHIGIPRMDPDHNLSTDSDTRTANGNHIKCRELTKSRPNSKISPITEKRWSMQELEAAYQSMKGLVPPRRLSETLTEAPSFTSLNDSEELQKLFVGSNADEAADSLSPLNLEGRDSPANSLKLSYRPTSPGSNGQWSERAKYSRHPSPASNFSSVNTSTSEDKYDGSGTTAPTTARSSRTLDKPSHELNLERAFSETSSRKPGSRDLLTTGSVCASDDTGWMTPKTSFQADTRSEHKSTRPYGFHGSIKRPTSSSSLTTSIGSLSQFHTLRSKAEQQSRIGTSEQPPYWYDDRSGSSGLGLRSRPSHPVESSSLRRQYSDQRDISRLSFASTNVPTDGASTLSEAKKADKIDLFLRCTKAEGMLQTLVTQSALEKEALQDALQESRHVIDELRQQRENLLEDLDKAKQAVGRRGSHSQETSRQIAEMVEARDTWQARAQAAERELQTLQQSSNYNDSHAKSLIAQLETRLRVQQEQLASTRAVATSKIYPSPPSLTSPKSRRSPVAYSKLPISANHASLSRSSSSYLPRPQRTSSGSIPAQPAGTDRESRAISTASTLDTDFGDHLPAPTHDGWSGDDSQDASLRLDDHTAQFLQDIDSTEIAVRH